MYESGMSAFCGISAKRVRKIRVTNGNAVGDIAKLLIEQIPALNGTEKSYAAMSALKN